MIGLGQLSKCLIKLLTVCIPECVDHYENVVFLIVDDFFVVVTDYNTKSITLIVHDRLGPYIFFDFSVVGILQKGIDQFHCHLFGIIWISDMLLAFMLVHD